MSLVFTMKDQIGKWKFQSQDYARWWPAVYHEYLEPRTEAFISNRLCFKNKSRGVIGEFIISSILFYVTGDTVL